MLNWTYLSDTLLNWTYLSDTLLQIMYLNVKILRWAYLNNVMLHVIDLNIKCYIKLIWIKTNLYIMTTELCCLLRPFYHDRENTHDFVRTEQGKWWNLCDFGKTLLVSLYRSHCNTMLHCINIGFYSLKMAPCGYRNPHYKPKMV